MSASISRADGSGIEPAKHGVPERMPKWLFSERTAERLVRMVILLSVLISAEPWCGRRRRPARVREYKAGNWAISFRNLFN